MHHYVCFIAPIDYCAVLYKYNMVLREVVKITGPEVLDAWDYFPKRSGGK